MSDSFKHIFKVVDKKTNEEIAFELSEDRLKELIDEYMVKTHVLADAVMNRMEEGQRLYLGIDIPNYRMITINTPVNEPYLNDPVFYPVFTLEGNYKLEGTIEDGLIDNWFLVLTYIPRIKGFLKVHSEWYNKNPDKIPDMETLQEIMDFLPDDLYADIYNYLCHIQITTKIQQNMPKVEEVVDYLYKVFEVSDKQQVGESVKVYTLKQLKQIKMEDIIVVEDKKEEMLPFVCSICGSPQNVICDTLENRVALKGEPYLKDLPICTDCILQLYGIDIENGDINFN